MTCTDKQVELLLKYIECCTQEVAAAKAGMSLRTAKRYLKSGGKRRKKKPEERTWRTRKDPFSEVWPELRAFLERDQGLEAQTLMDWLLATYPEKFQPGQVRTLRRRVRDWRVLEGPERKEIMFAQTIMPAKQSQSDYTHCNRLEITIAGEVFPHMLFHFMLPYSRWEYVWVCFSESFETLTTGFGKAIRELGAVAPEHRTDNLAAAVPVGEPHTFQERWKSFLSHFGVTPSANNPRKSNENGSVEKSHDLFKHALDQRLRMRGSRDFKTLAEYENYLQNMCSERNRVRSERFAEEKQLLIALPPTEWYDPKQYSVIVSGWSTVSLEGATYSVPTRYIGQRLKALVHSDEVRIYYGKFVVLCAPRRERGGKEINYRHLILHLLKKPGAFRNYQFRDELFPRIAFRRAYDALLAHDDEKADKEYLRILNTASLEGESKVAAAIEQLLLTNALPRSERIDNLCKTEKQIPTIHINAPNLKNYDQLLKSQFTGKS